MKVSDIELLREEFVNADSLPISPADFDHLVGTSGCSGDVARLRRHLRRRQLGEPLEYIVGHQVFRGRRFTVDKRVYITDQELTHLVDTVVKAGREFMATHNRPPTLVEFGVGCGSLAISVKQDFPEAEVIGVDLDSDAIAVARENAAFHQVDIQLVESDLFSDLPRGVVPDIIFGDPPWGDNDSIYDEARPAAHYHAMPPLSAFPVGSITAVHEAILADVFSRSWASQIILNLGVLDKVSVNRLTGVSSWHEIFTFDNSTSILHCRMVGTF